MSIKSIAVVLEGDACMMQVAVGYNGPCGGDCGGCGGYGKAVVRIKSHDNMLHRGRRG